MTEQERMAHLETAYTALRAAYEEQGRQLAQALETIARLQEQLGEREAQLAKDSHNSGKPPSSDGLKRRLRPVRAPSSQRSGGQPGHRGRTLELVEVPDVVVPHAPAVCAHCEHELVGMPGAVVERRQVHDLPPLRLEVTEHQAMAVRCPVCQTVTRGAVPDEVSAAAQYGPRLRALAVYLNQYQLVPQARTHEALADLFGCTVSDGTLATWVEQAAATLAPTVAYIADLVAAGSHQHADETGLRIQGHLHWLHVNSTRWLTHLAWHPKRGKNALEAIGIWPRFRGRATHDRWASYDAYTACTHSLCAAHLVRELAFLAEEHQQVWAGALRDLLLGMHAATQDWRARGAVRLPAHERDQWIAQYHELLAQGFAAQPPPPAPGAEPRRRGRRKQTPAKNLLDALLQHSTRVLAFLDDLAIPFTNNQAERDLRMTKVQQKVSGTFRSETGPTAYCRLRSYLSTMRKQGRGMLEAIAAVFAGSPFPVAWGF
jgi:transposase